MNTAKAIALCNRALVDIGAVPITSFEDGTDTAIVADTRYESLVQELLSVARWEFATIQSQLSLLADTEPLAEWSYCHQLPTNPKFLTLVRVVATSNSIEPSQLLWPRVRGGTEYTIRTIMSPSGGESQRLALLSNYETVIIEYVGRVEETQWSAAFDECVVIRLAQAFAEAITGNTAMVAVMIERLHGRRGQIGQLGRAIFQDRTNTPRRGLLDDGGLISGR